MTEELITEIDEEVWETAELDDPGYYYWKIEGPGTVGKRAKFDDDGNITEEEETALSCFLIAQTKAEYDSSGNFVNEEPVTGVSINKNFNYVDSRGKVVKNKIREIKSLYFAARGLELRAVDGKYNVALAGAEMDGAYVWGALKRFKNKQGKLIQFVANFKSKVPERTKVG